VLFLCAFTSASAGRLKIKGAL